jgi:signal transduction histidine kinase
MELHGGRVEAQNRAGGGLEVTLELPRGPAPEA